MHKHFLAALFFITVSTVFAAQVPLPLLETHADALNIEGGMIPKQLLNPNQVWGNMTVILDRPMVTGKTLDEITAENHYPLKEASILEYDELKVNKAYGLLLSHYLTHAREIAQVTDKTKPVKLLVQIHRNRSAKAQFELFKTILSDALTSQALIDLSEKIIADDDTLGYFYAPEQNCLMAVRKSVFLDAASAYTDADIVLGFGLAAGLNQDLPSGTLLLPDTFIPYDVGNNELMLEETYSVTNDIRERLPQILSQQDVTRHEVHSDNPLKRTQFDGRFSEQDFNEVVVLQADKLFTPKLSGGVATH